MNPFHQRRMTRIALGCTLAATLAACGGGSGTAAKTGYFIDSAVQGLQYKSGTLTGFTDSSGAFQYEEGQPVTFSIGSLELGSVTVTHSRVFPVDLIAGAKDETHPKVSLMAQVLQTLDSDGDASNGITITDSTRQALNQVIQLASADPTQAASALTRLLATATQGRSNALVAAGPAQSHLQANLVQEYAGNWSGSFSGSASTGATFTGVYSRGGLVTGQWRNSQYNLSGTWTLKKV
jgi:para-nitrobenzyl esterase